MICKMTRSGSEARSRLSEVAALLAVGIRRLAAKEAGAGAGSAEQVRVDFSPAQSVCGSDVTEKETAS